MIMVVRVRKGTVVLHVDMPSSQQLHKLSKVVVY